MSSWGALANWVYIGVKYKNKSDIDKAESKAKDRDFMTVF